MNISFTKKQEEYIAEQVASGDYQNNSEVIRDALRLHSIYRDKVVEDLRRKIQEARESGISKQSVKEFITELKQGV